MNFIKRNVIFFKRHFVLLQSCDKFNLWIRSDEAKCNWFIWRKNYCTKYLNGYIFQKTSWKLFRFIFFLEGFKTEQAFQPWCYYAVENYIMEFFKSWFTIIRKYLLQGSSDVATSENLVCKGKGFGRVRLKYTHLYHLFFSCPGSSIPDLGQ